MIKPSPTATDPAASASDVAPLVFEDFVSEIRERQRDVALQHPAARFKIADDDTLDILRAASAAQQKVTIVVDPMNFRILRVLSPPKK